MKMMKLALLGTAALAAVSVSARADDLADLKAQIEALNSRISQLETAPSVPAGYQLLTMSKGDATIVPGNNWDMRDKGYSDQAHIIGILPTADMPATTSIEWSGYVRAIVANLDGGEYYEDSNTGIFTRAQLKVVGKTDTAVGEVGARIQFRSENFYEAVDSDYYFKANEYWGWWAMTPNLTFGGGYSGSLGNIGYGVDGACNCYFTDWWTNEFRNTDRRGPPNAPNPGDTHQIRLSWADGPIGAAIALEDSTYEGASVTDPDWDDLAVAGEITYAGDSFSGEVSAIWYEHSTGTYGDDGWQVGAGVGFGLGDMANVSLQASLGDNPIYGDYWMASGLINVNLSDSIHAEAGIAHSDYDDFEGGSDITEVLVGAYYDPVAQLTLGLEAEWAESDSFDEGDFTVFDFVTVWRF